MKNKRNFNRVELDEYIDGNFVLKRGNKDYVIPITITDISGGGVGFLSNYDLPLSRDNIFKFNFTLDMEFSIDGFIKVKALTDGDEFRYGVEFINVDDITETDLVREVNKHELFQRNSKKKW
jgi:c-di-GMP-binding flagellar brake protein YcgR